MPIKNSSTNNTPRQDLLGAFSEYDPQSAGYIGTLLFPTFGVQEYSGTFGKIPMEAHLALVDTKRAVGAATSRSSWEPESDTFALAEYSHEEPLDTVGTRIWRSWFNAEEVAAQRVRAIIERDFENDVQAAVFNTTNFPLSGSTGLGITNEWDDATNGVPIDDVFAGHDALQTKGVVPNTLLITANTWRALSQSSQILNRIKYVSAEVMNGLLPLSALAQVFHVDQILVANAHYNSAKPGATAVAASLWSDEYAFLCRVATGGDLASPHVGRTFELADAAGIEVYETPIDAKRYAIGATFHRQAKLLYTGAGFLFGNVNTL